MISVDGTRHCKSRGINARSTASVEEEHIKQIDHTLNTSIDPQCLFPLRRQCIQPVLPLAKHSQISVLSLRLVIINTFAHPYFNPFANRTSHEPRSSPITARIVACSEPPPSAVDLLAEHARTRTGTPWSQLTARTNLECFLLLRQHNRFVFVRQSPECRHSLFSSWMKPQSCMSLLSQVRWEEGMRLKEM